ncbi:hypothetical protein B0H12DRAFT_1135989 [Mycena haematopus]|nr:hypothetical protein B0H12DRAFT_1135989 [Mycena haematopus]
MSRLKSAFKPTLKASIFPLQDPRACWLISGCDPQGYQHLDAVMEMGRWDEGCVLVRTPTSPFRCASLTVLIAQLFCGAWGLTNIVVDLTWDTSVFIFTGTSAYRIVA